MYVFVYFIAGSQLSDALNLLLAGGIPISFIISSTLFILLVFLVFWLTKSLFVLTTLLASQARPTDVNFGTAMSYFFGESFRLIWSYICIAFCRFVYVVWPIITYVLLYAGFVFIVAIIFPSDNIYYAVGLPLILTMLVFVLGLRFLPIKDKDQYYSWVSAFLLALPGVVLFWAIWRAMCVVLAVPLLVMHNKQPNPAKCIRTSIKIARQNALLFIFSLLTFVIIITGINRLITILEEGILYRIIENEIAPAFLTMIIQHMDQHLLGGLASGLGIISNALVSSVFAVLLVLIINAIFLIAIILPFATLFFKSLAKVAGAK